MFTAILVAALMSPTAQEVQRTYNELVYITGYCEWQYTDNGWHVHNYLQREQLSQIPEGAAILKQAQPIYIKAQREGRAFAISKHECYMRNDPALDNFKQALIDYHTAHSSGRE